MAFNFLCTLSFLVLFSSTFQTSSVISVPLPSDSSEKVSLAIYYQSIGNAEFMSKYVPLIFRNELNSIVDLHLSPGANTHLLNNKTITCQGGEDECDLNIVEACAIYAWPDVVKHFNFIACVESMVYNDNISESDTCFDRLKLDRTPIEECYESGLGAELQELYAKETKALKPPPKFSPWVVVNGKPIEDIENFMSYICKAYKGSSLPEVCKHLPNISSPSIKAKTVHQVGFGKNVVTAEATKFARLKMKN